MRQKLAGGASVAGALLCISLGLAGCGDSPTPAHHSDRRLAEGFARRVKTFGLVRSSLVLGDGKRQQCGLNLVNPRRALVACSTAKISR